MMRNRLAALSCAQTVTKPAGSDAVMQISTIIYFLRNCLLLRFKRKGTQIDGISTKA